MNKPYKSYVVPNPESLLKKCQCGTTISLCDSIRNTNVETIENLRKAIRNHRNHACPNFTDAVEFRLANS